MFKAKIWKSWGTFRDFAAQSYVPCLGIFLQKSNPLERHITVYCMRLGVSFTVRGVLHSDAFKENHKYRCGLKKKSGFVCICLDDGYMK